MQNTQIQYVDGCRNKHSWTKKTGRMCFLLIVISLCGCAGPAKQESLVGFYASTSKDGVAVELSTGGDTAQALSEFDGPLWLAGGRWREEETREGNHVVVIWWGDESIRYSITIRDGVTVLTKQSSSLHTPFGNGIEYASEYRKELRQSSQPARAMSPRG